MEKHLPILFEFETNSYPAFSTDYLAEILEVSISELKGFAKAGKWKSFIRREVEPDGNIFCTEVWDALSMQVGYRLYIAACHYRDEEDDCTLLDKCRAELIEIAAVIPNFDRELFLAALYRHHQFEIVLDVVRTMQLCACDAITAISSVFCISPSILSEISTKLDQGRECVFLKLESEARFVALLQYFSTVEGDKLPELTTPAESVSQ